MVRVRCVQRSEGDRLVAEADREWEAAQVLLRAMKPKQAALNARYGRARVDVPAP